MSIDRDSQRGTARYTDDGKQKMVDERMNLPDDLANGLVPILLKNWQPSGLPKTLSTLVATPKPRLVKLEVTRTSDDPFTSGRTSYKASHFRLKVDLDGVAR